MAFERPVFEEWKMKLVTKHFEKDQKKINTSLNDGETSFINIDEISLSLGNQKYKPLFDSERKSTYFFHLIIKTQKFLLLVSAQWSNVKETTSH